MIKPNLEDIPLFLVGGMRNVSHMEEVLENNYADFISMSRPFIREPNLVNKIKDGKIEKVSCVSAIDVWQPFRMKFRFIATTTNFP